MVDRLLGRYVGELVYTLVPAGRRIYSISVKLPSACGDNRLTVVDRYKHLGGIITSTGNMTPEMEHRSGLALQAFTPLATQIFGSVHVPRHFEMSFVYSLIYSRLLFNAHVWKINPKMISKLNTVRTRVLRTVCGEMRFSATSSSLSDREVRGELGDLSIDCLIPTLELYSSRAVGQV